MCPNPSLMPLNTAGLFDPAAGGNLELGLTCHPSGAAAPGMDSGCACFRLEQWTFACRPLGWQHSVLNLVLQHHGWEGCGAGRGGCQLWSFFPWFLGVRPWAAVRGRKEDTLQTNVSHKRPLCRYILTNTRPSVPSTAAALDRLLDLSNICSWVRLCITQEWPGL